MPKSNDFQAKEKNKSPNYAARIVIEDITPQVDEGHFPIKRVVGENVVVRANVFADGHDEIFVTLNYRSQKENKWSEVLMKPLGNDGWIGTFPVEKAENYIYSIKGYIDHFNTWRHDLEKKILAKQDISIDLLIGVGIIEETKKRIKKKSLLNQIDSYLEKIQSKIDAQSLLSLLMETELVTIIQNHPDLEKGSIPKKELRVKVEPKKALFSSWYEFFPRSWSPKPHKHATFKDCEKILPEIARMGFDIIYLPPIHPIGHTKRKGKNNAVDFQKNDPGCPWAIGSEEGGHKEIHSELGTLESFKNFIKAAKSHHLEVALDLAFQCSPDHPYAKKHPQWFKWRPDGTVQFAENPPKKYEDVLPINFDTEDAPNLWEELKSIVLFWIEQGVYIFRVDNPHTKPFAFWDWLISEITKEYPQIIFLSEAFTRPHLMYRLAKAGFNQSYTYFTWRNTKQEFISYLTELTQTPVAEYMRPNFWPNTPDILPEHLQRGGRNAFIIRAVLASTLSSNYGIYGPAFELCVSEAIENKEEYLNSEKYEIKQWDWNKKGHIKEILTRLNQIRKNNPALHITRNIRFCEINNDSLLAYYKATSDYSNIILVIVNLDPDHIQAGMLQIPVNDLGMDMDKEGRYVAQDLLNDNQYTWQGDRTYIELNPQHFCAHIIQLKAKVKPERDFDYYM